MVLAQELKDEGLDAKYEVCRNYVRVLEEHRIVTIVESRLAFGVHASNYRMDHGYQLLIDENLIDQRGFEFANPSSIDELVKWLKNLR